MDAKSLIIRPGTQEDVPALARIYNHYVETSPATFDVQPHSLEARMEWFHHYAPTGPHRLLVAELGGIVVGHSTSSPFKDRPAYATSIECSVYVAPEAHGNGIGRRLYEALFESLAGEDLHRAFAGVTQPNEPSMRLHRAVGFVETGIFKEAGRKFGKFWDVLWLAKDMP